MKRILIVLLLLLILGVGIDATIADTIGTPKTRRENKYLIAIIDDNLSEVSRLAEKYPYLIEYEKRFYAPVINMYYNKTPLQIACIYGSYEVVDYLIEHGADCNIQVEDYHEDDYTSTMTPLMLAVCYGMEENPEGAQKTIRLLIDADCDVLLKDYSGKTALDYAIEKQYEELIELFERISS